MVWRINLRQFEAFRSVMMTGSTTKAADVLNISQPAISRLIRDFEGQLDVELFSRHQGRLQPTAHAEWLFEQSAGILARFDRLNSQIQDMRSALREELQITATPPMAYGVLPDAIGKFREEQPETSVSVQIIVRREIRNWMAEQNFDLSVTTFPVDYPTQEKETLVSVPAVCILSEEHPLSKKTVVTASDLTTAQLVLQVPESLFRLRLDRALEQAGFNQETSLETQTASSVCAYVAAGLGVGVVDPFAAYRFRKMGLVIRPFMPRLDLEYGLLHPTQKQRHKHSEAFVAIVRQCTDDILEWYDSNVPGWRVDD